MDMRARGRAVLSLGYQLVGPPGPVGMSERTGAVIPYIIIAAVVAQLFYAQTMRTKGVLR